MQRNRIRLPATNGGLVTPPSDHGSRKSQNVESTEPSVPPMSRAGPATLRHRKQRIMCPRPVVRLHPKAMKTVGGDVRRWGYFCVQVARILDGVGVCKNALAILVPEKGALGGAGGGGPIRRKKGPKNRKPNQNAEGTLDVADENPVLVTCSLRALNAGILLYGFEAHSNVRFSLMGANLEILNLEVLGGIEGPSTCERLRTRGLGTSKVT